MTARAKEPFRFCARLGLTIMTGIKAKDAKELAQHLKTVPESCIYQHTHRFLEQHQYLVPEPPNDFAYWVRHVLQDEKLGEEIAAIDTVRFNSLEELRLALVGKIEKAVHGGGNGRSVPDGAEFHFMRANRFSVPTSHQALDLGEFAECLKKVSISSLYLHIFEAKLRPPLGVNDFSNWFDKQLGEKDLAKKVASLDPYTHTLEGLRLKIFGFIEARLKEASFA